MSAGIWRLTLWSPDGVSLGDLTYYSSVTVRYGVSRAGECRVTLDGTVKRVGYWQPYTTMEIWRTPGGFAKSYLEGDRLWYLMDVAAYHDSRGASYQELTFYDANALLEQRYILYEAETAYTRKTGYADNMIKALVRENAGSLAVDTGRDMSAWLTVQDDLSLAPSISRAFAWRPLGNTLRDICADSLEHGVYLAYDCVRTSPTTSELRTYVGQRGVSRVTGSVSPVVLSWDAGNLRNPRLQRNIFGTTNYILAAGQGQGKARVTATVAEDNLTPLTRRERFVDCRHVDISNTSALQAEADSEYTRYHARYQFTDELAETPYCTYGVNVLYGDRVTVNYGGFVYDAHLDDVSLRLNQDGSEDVEIAVVSYE